MKKKTAPSYVRPKGDGPKNLNQHAPIFFHKATKRNRSKNAQKKNAIRDSFLAPTMI